MDDRLKTIVDLEKYPIHDLNSTVIQKLIQRHLGNLFYV